MTGQIKQRFFVLYGYDDPENAPVLEVIGECVNGAQAWRETNFVSGALYSYTVTTGAADSMQLVDERFEGTRYD